jgi:crossover junction endodeoxyribonuclease RuvC
MRVLGIDPGSRYCGFGVVEDAGGTRVRHLAHGVLALGDARPIEDRLRELHEGLSRQILEHRPQVVAVEDVFHAKNARSALVLGQARGVALLAAAQAGAKVRSFPPSVIKLAVTGSGRAEKEQVGRMVSVLLGVALEGRLDASDALAAAICCVLRRNVEITVERASGQGGAAPPRRDWRAALARKVGR